MTPLLVLCCYCVCTLKINERALQEIHEAGQGTEREGERDGANLKAGRHSQDTSGLETAVKIALNTHYEAAI